MNQQYLIPANSKKSALIFGLFRMTDIIVFGTGITLSLIFLFAFTSTGLKAMIFKFLPVGITGFLVFPVPNYHNVLVFLTEMYKFYTGRRIYLWKGWCIASEAREEKK